MRQLGWITLFAVLLMVACGPPEISDINGGSTGPIGDDDTGDDDDDAATTFPTATTPPGAAPTLTNVPSFATWNATIRPLMCPGCHTGSSGGLTFGTQTEQSSLKYFWFESICNQDDPVAPTAGMQAYSPAAGRYQQYMRGNEPAAHTDIDPNAAVVDAWLAQGAGTAVPSCNDYYNLAGSS